MALGSIYRDWIVETGKQPELFVLVAFLLTFGFIRTSTHLIRAQVKWWPGNVSIGGTHVHHLVWGIAGGLAGLVLIGLRAWLDVADETEVVARASIGSAVVLHLAFSLACAVEGKYVSAALGIVVPFAGLIGAIRLAKPRSLWARFYGADKLARAVARQGRSAAIPASQPFV